MDPGRAPLLVLPLLALLLLPPAGAQGQDPLAMRVEVEPLDAPLAPLQGPGTTTVTVDAPCVVPGADPARPTLNLWVADAPPWARAVVSPGALAVDPARCQGGRYVAIAQLAVVATDQAPAFTPMPLAVHAAWEGASPNVTGSGRLDVVAGFFSILDVQLQQPIQTVRPGEAAAFPLVVTNLGNDRVLVTVEPTSAPDGSAPTPGYTPAPVTPLTLESRQKGGAVTSATLQIQVQTEERAGYSNEVGTVSYRVRAAHATDPTLQGDSTTVSVLVTVKGFNASPGPGLPALLVGLLAAGALARRVRR